MLDAYIIVIGDEILSGRTQDTNSHYIARRLNELGITLKSILTIGDNKIVIQETIKSTLDIADVIFISGGLGPTPDDSTVISVANVLKRRLILDESVLAKVEKYFQNQHRVVPELATKQALVPQDAVILENPVGQAPGLILKVNKKSIILLPGVPIELQKIFETGVLPYLHYSYLLKPGLTLVIRTTNIPEMEIAAKLADITKRYKDVAIAYLPSMLGVDVRVNKIRDEKVYNSIEKDIVTRLKSYIYSNSQEEIEEVIGKLLKRKQLTLSIAESCTGGLASDKITDVPGSSEYYIGGAVVYNNKLKKLICGVKENTLKKFGAVSKETVSELATGIRERFSTDIGLSVSGIAGPAGATKEKPVGLVYVGVATKKGVNFEEHYFSGNRQMIKEKAAMAALDLLRRTIEIH